jgi:hypothetical protein
LHERPFAFGSAPVGKKTLVASTTLSRPLRSALPTISSERPSAYPSAVSMKFPPDPEMH